MNRTAFLIDGFNLYHSVKEASTALHLGGAGTRWLNFHSLCASYLHLIGRGASLEGVYYFSALARHLEAAKPDVTLRHRNYIECLKDTGVTVELGRFKEKHVHCTHCKKDVLRHEEKETDVAICVKLLEFFFLISAMSLFSLLVTPISRLLYGLRNAFFLLSRFVSRFPMADTIMNL
jgi:hypothetical protein